VRDQLTGAIKAGEMPSKEEGRAEKRPPMGGRTL